MSLFLRMEFSVIKDSFRIEMVETGRGCKEACIHCGAYTGFERDDLQPKILSVDEIYRNLMRIIDRTRGRIFTWLNPVVTTHVNQEPLGPVTNFPAFAEMVEMVTYHTGRRSRVACISHGVRAGNEAMVTNLQKIIRLMERKTIPLFVLSVDSARSRGKISAGVNEESYYQTLDLLRQALPYGRVTVSLQGDSDPQSPLYIERTVEMFERVCHRLQLSDEERKKLVVTDSRGYTRIGRAQKDLKILNSVDCDVIPDPEFVEKEVPRGHQWRGMVRMDGSLVAQPNRPGRTYGDSVNESLWQTLSF